MEKMTITTWVFYVGENNSAINFQKVYSLKS
jgi:hypothetical protein